MDDLARQTHQYCSSVWQGHRIADLAKRLAELEDKTKALAMNHDIFSRNTKAQLKQVFDALRELMTPPDPPKRPIGFVQQTDKK